MSLLGVKWSGTRITLFLSKTVVAPISPKAWMAKGAVISFPRAISTRALMISPGTTSAMPEWAAKIFSVIVIPILQPFPILFSILQLVQGIDICLGTGHNHVRVSPLADRGSSFFLQPPSHLSLRLGAAGNRVDGELGKLRPRARDLLDRLKSGIHRPV